MNIPPGHRSLSGLMELVVPCPRPSQHEWCERGGVGAGENAESSSTKPLQGFSVAAVYQVCAQRLDVVRFGYHRFAGTCLCYPLQILKTEETIARYSCKLKKTRVMKTCCDTPQPVALGILSWDSLGGWQQCGS